MPLSENFDFGFDIALDHAFAEILDGVFGVNKDVVPAEIAGAAVEGCHFGHKLDGWSLSSSLMPTAPPVEG